jgi:tRNA U38,U39,U40 pseudouridine synthase TruA
MISQLFPDYATPNSIRLASRTDAKVGAHRSSCDFFLQYPSQIPIFPPSIIQKSLNLNFAKRNIDIYIPNVCLVNNEFNSMKDAKLRKYVYKIKTGKNLSSYIFDKSEYLVIEKSNYAKWDIDYNKINEIIPIFTSKHYDFRNFCVTKGIDER